MNAERGGDFAAVMDVMFEHTTDDRLERNRGPHSPRQKRRIQPHLGVWLERRLDLVRVTHAVRLSKRRNLLFEISRGQASKRLLDHAPCFLQSGDEFRR